MDWGLFSNLFLRSYLFSVAASFVITKTLFKNLCRSFVRLGSGARSMGLFNALSVAHSSTLSHSRLAREAFFFFFLRVFCAVLDRRLGRRPMLFVCNKTGSVKATNKKSNSTSILPVLYLIAIHCLGIPSRCGCTKHLRQFSYHGSVKFRWPGPATPRNLDKGTPLVVVPA